MLVADDLSPTVLLSPRRSDGLGGAEVGPSALPVTRGGDPEEEDLGDEEDLAVSEPLTDEESNFDDFDDDFDDDFEEEENDPDWDHPDESEAAEPPPGKGGGRKK
jgi:hypothetical protein